MDIRNDKKEFIWFLKSALSSLLPKAWKKEKWNGKVYYHNSKTHITTEKHPLLYKFRSIFNAIVKKKPKPVEPPEQGKLLVPKSRWRMSIQAEKSLLTEEKPFMTRKQYNTTFNELMAKYNDQQDILSTPKYQATQDAMEFYKAIFEDQIDKPPDLLKHTYAYMTVLPEEVQAKAVQLEIDQYHNLYWIARVALIIPLPPYWFRMKINGQNKFVNKQWQISTKKHPAVPFLEELITENKFLELESSRKTVVEPMIFMDSQGLEYLVDFENFEPGKLNAITYLVDSNAYIHDKETGQHYRKQQDTDLVEFHDKLMIFDIAEGIGVNLDNELHLLWAIYNFIGNLRQSGEIQDWQFRYTLEGESYWLNSRTKKCRATFPYLSAVKAHVDQVRRLLIDRANLVDKAIDERHNLFKNKDIYKFVIKYAKGYASEYVHRTWERPFNPPYDLTELRDTAGLEHENRFNDMMDLLFSNPFDLQHDVDLMKHDGFQYTLVTDDEQQFDEQESYDSEDMAIKELYKEEVREMRKMSQYRRKGAILHLPSIPESSSQSKLDFEIKVNSSEFDTISELESFSSFDRTDESQRMFDSFESYAKKATLEEAPSAGQTKGERKLSWSKALKVAMDSNQLSPKSLPQLLEASLDQDDNSEKPSLNKENNAEQLIKLDDTKTCEVLLSPKTKLNPEIDSNEQVVEEFKDLTDEITESIKLKIDKLKVASNPVVQFIQNISANLRIPRSGMASVWLSPSLSLSQRSNTPDNSVALELSNIFKTRKNRLQTAAPQPRQNPLAAVTEDESSPSRQENPSGDSSKPVAALESTGKDAAPKTTQFAMNLKKLIALSANTNPPEDKQQIQTDQDSEKAPNRPKEPSKTIPAVVRTSHVVQENSSPFTNQVQKKPRRQSDFSSSSSDQLKRAILIKRLQQNRTKIGFPSQKTDRQALIPLDTQESSISETYQNAAAQNRRNTMYINQSANETENLFRQLQTQSKSQPGIKRLPLKLKRSQKEVPRFSESQKHLSQSKAYKKMRKQLKRIVASTSKRSTDKPQSNYIDRGKQDNLAASSPWAQVFSSFNSTRQPLKQNWHTSRMRTQTASAVQLSPPKFSQTIDQPAKTIDLYKVKKIEDLSNLKKGKTIQITADLPVPQLPQINTTRSSSGLKISLPHSNLIRR